MDVRCSLKLILGIWKSSPEPPLLPLLVLNFFLRKTRFQQHTHSNEDNDEKNDNNDKENENNKDNNNTRKDSLLAE